MTTTTATAVPLDQPPTMRAVDTLEAPIVVDRHWPRLDPTAFHGTAGQLVRALAPTTEADPAALLAVLLAEFGWLVGAQPGAGKVPGAAHMMIANEAHHARIFPIIVGRTSSGAKGTAQHAIDRIIRAHAHGMLGSPPRGSGLSSGEGLVEAVRDEIGDPEDEKNYKPGIEDKRLLLVESELATTFRRMNREGATLGPTIRQAWDGSKLSVLNRLAYTATGAHIVIIGHISPGELHTVIRSHDLDGGTLNRFLFIASRRSKRLPDGGNAPKALVDEYSTRLGQAASHAYSRGEVTMTSEARDRWRSTYNRLTAERPDTVLTKATSRRAPQVLRLAMLYALIDDRGEITADDLAAAESLEQYSVDTAKYIFQQSIDADADEVGRLAEYIRRAGEAGRARNEIREDLYQRNVSADVITQRLKLLIEAGAVEQRQEPTAGRPRTLYVAR